MNEYRQSMLEVFQHYLEKRELDNQSEFFSYDVIDNLENAKLQLFQSHHLASDFREIINCYHDWTMKITSWATWNLVLADYTENESKAWEIRNEFLEPIVFFCLYQPASFKDLLIRFCTLAFHFGNLNLDSNYKDDLDEDIGILKRLQNNHPEPNNYFLSRLDAIKQLRRISKSWEIGQKILDLLEKLDDQTYKTESKNWRNHAAHYLPPRLGFGDTRTVTRQVQFRTSLVKEASGFFSHQQDTTCKQIAYAFGGTSPLDIGLVFQANSRQRLIAHELLVVIHNLLNEIVQINLKNKPIQPYPNADTEQFAESAPIGNEFGAKK